MMTTQTPAAGKVDQSPTPTHNFLFSIPLWLLLLMSPVRLDLMGKGLSTYKKMEVEVLSLKFGQAG